MISQLDHTIDPNIPTRIQLRPEEQYLECTCGNSWFEEILVSRKKKHHYVIPGQKVPQAVNSPGPFILLRCVGCGESYEPQLAGITPQVREAYDKVMNELRGPEVEATVNTNVTTDAVGHVVERPAPTKETTQSTATATEEKSQDK